MNNDTKSLDKESVSPDNNVGIKLLPKLKAGIKLLLLFYGFYLRQKHQAMPYIKRAARLMFFGAFLATQIILTWHGVHHKLADSYNGLLTTLVTTIGTMVAIFFSLVLIPLNQISSKYSPRFLTYLKRDQFFIGVLTYSVASLLYCTIFTLKGANGYIAEAVSLQFGLVVLFLAASWFHVIYIANPLNGILTPFRLEVTKRVRKAIPKYEKRRLKSLMSLSPNTVEVAQQTSKFQVDKAITDYIQRELTPVRQIALKAIKELEVEQATYAIGTLTAIVIDYLKARNQYSFDDDPILYTTYTEFKLLSEAANDTELKLQLHQFMVECWQSIGITAAKVNIKGLPQIQNNLNSLVVYPIKALVEICALNFAEVDSYAPTKACEALGDIGVTLMSEGYEQQAAHAVEELARISLVAEKSGINLYAGTANRAIMQIYGAGLGCRNKATPDPQAYSFTLISNSISKLLDSFLVKKRNVTDNMLLSPLIGNLLDIFNGINIARVDEAGIFSTGLTVESIIANLHCVDDDISKLEKAINSLLANNDDYFASQAIENIYRLSLTLLSYLQPAMAPDHILYMPEQTLMRNNESVSQAISALNKCFRVLSNTAVSRSKSFIHDDDLSILLSLYLIILFERKRSKTEAIETAFKNLHQTMVNCLVTYSGKTDSKPNDTFYKYFRLLKQILYQNKYYKLERDFDVPEYQYNNSGFVYALVTESPYPQPVIGRSWIIKRPLLQRNAYYYNEVEKLFGIRDE